MAASIPLLHRAPRDVKKTLTPRIKNVKNRVFMNLKKSLKMLNKKVVDKLTKLIKPNEKFASKITVLTCMTTFDGYGYSPCMRELFIAAVLHPSPKSRFMQEFSWFSRILARLVGYKNSPLENKKRCKK